MIPITRQHDLGRDTLGYVSATGVLVLNSNAAGLDFNRCDVNVNAADAVRRFYGLPPHNTPENFEYRDGYYAAAKCEEFNVSSMEELARRVGVKIPR